MEELTYNELQEVLLDQFIDNGGQLWIAQQGRGRGYTTFAIMQCLQQLFSTDRNVVFVSDIDYGWIRDEICRLAFYQYGEVASYNKYISAIRLGGRELRILKPAPHSSISVRVDDIYGDVSANTIDNCEGFFHTLASRQGRSGDDGTGFRCYIVR